MFKTLVFALLALETLAVIQNDKALFDDDPEARIKKRRGRPCRGRTPEGRTFFDWSFQYVDLNYNYNHNYNINCGGGNYGGGGVHHGGGGGVLHGGGGNGGNYVQQQPQRPQKPILSGVLQSLGNGLAGNNQGGGLFGTEGPIFGPITFVQSQVQSILANPPSRPTSQDSGSGGSFPGFFNGQGVLSLFENGLFSGIFDRPNPSYPSNTQNRPINTPSGPTSPPYRPTSPPYRPTVAPIRPTTSKPDPDDIIYNDEKPVHEDHDPVFPDQYSRPGSFYNRPRPRPTQYQNYRSNRIRFTD